MRILLDIARQALDKFLRSRGPRATPSAPGYGDPDANPCFRCGRDAYHALPCCGQYVCGRHHTDHDNDRQVCGCRR
jgi:hypothetical protein